MRQFRKGQVYLLPSFGQKVDLTLSYRSDTTRITGRTSDYGLEAEPGEEAKLPLSLSVFTHKPAERAIRAAIGKAVSEIIKLTPPEYFRN